MRQIVLCFYLPLIALTSTAENFRTSKTLFKKLHKGATFLAGVKLGSYLAHKKFLTPVLGHGSLASAHNFQLFGKTFSSALSLSYGDGPIGLPVLNDPVDLDNNSSLKAVPVQHVLITVLDNPTAQTLEKLKMISKVDGNFNNGNEMERKNLTASQTEEFQRFLQKHNQRVNILNHRNISSEKNGRGRVRLNNKIL